MPVLAGRGSNLAKHTYESKINLAKGGPDFASFAKFGDKIANLATLTLTRLTVYQSVTCFVPVFDKKKEGAWSS